MSKKRSFVYIFCQVNITAPDGQGLVNVSYLINIHDFNRYTSTYLDLCRNLAYTNE